MTSRSLDKLHRGKLAELRKSNQFFAHPHDLHEREGFNPRDYQRPEVEAHIENLTQAYQNGAYVPPVTVQVIDGTIYIRDGHCRRLAMLRAIEQGIDLGPQPLIEFKGDDSEADALIVTSQAGVKLTPLEVAAVCQRMANRGKTKAEIAGLLGISSQHVSNLLNVHTLPDAIKQLVADDKVAATTALKVYDEYGEEAAGILDVAVKAEAPGKKVTPKAIKPRTPKPVTYTREQLEAAYMAGWKESVDNWNGEGFDGAEELPSWTENRDARLREITGETLL